MHMSTANSGGVQRVLVALGLVDALLPLAVLSLMIVKEAMRWHRYA